MNALSRMSDEELKVLIAEAYGRQGLESIRQCESCGAEADQVGVWIPDDPHALGAEPGHSRAGIYGVCTKCLPLSDAQLRDIERKFRVEFQPVEGGEQ